MPGAPVRVSDTLTIPMQLIGLRPATRPARATEWKGGGICNRYAYLWEQPPASWHPAHAAHPQRTEIPVHPRARPSSLCQL